MAELGMSFSPLRGQQTDEELQQILQRLASGGRIDISRMPAPTVRGGEPLFGSLLGGAGRPSLAEVLAPTVPTPVQQPSPPAPAPISPAPEPMLPGTPAPESFEPEQPGVPSDLEEPGTDLGPSGYSSEPLPPGGNEPNTGGGESGEPGYGDPAFPSPTEDMAFLGEEDELFASLLGGGASPV